MHIILKNHQGIKYCNGRAPVGFAIIGEVIQDRNGEDGALILNKNTGTICKHSSGFLGMDERELHMEIVKTLRNDARQTEAQFAAANGISPIEVASWENGSQTPNVSQIHSLLHTAGVI